MHSFHTKLHVSMFQMAVKRGLVDLVLECLDSFGARIDAGIPSTRQCVSHHLMVGHDIPVVEVFGSIETRAGQGMQPNALRSRTNTHNPGIT
jgi:hypothetical protein